MVKQAHKTRISFLGPLSKSIYNFSSYFGSSQTDVQLKAGCHITSLAEANVEQSLIGWCVVKGLVVPESSCSRLHTKNCSVFRDAFLMYLMHF